MSAQWREVLRWLALPLRKLVVFVIGTTILLMGIAAIVLPIPSVLIIIAGLTILAVEFTWARWLLKKTKSIMSNTAEKIGVKNILKKRSSSPRT